MAHDEYQHLRESADTSAWERLRVAAQDFYDRMVEDKGGWSIFTHEMSNEDQESSNRLAGALAAVRPADGQ